MRFVSIVRMLAEKAQKNPDKIAYEFLAESGHVAESITFGDLYARARTLASYLQQETTQQDRVVLLYPPGLEFIVAFMACLYANVIPVPAYPPEPHRLKNTLLRLENLIIDAQPSVILTTNEIHLLLNFSKIKNYFGGFLQKINNQNLNTRQSKHYLSKIKKINTLKIATHYVDDGFVPNVKMDEIAYLQYTSGSTGVPRGVMVSHENIYQNMQIMMDIFNYDCPTHILSWVPLQHDLGMMMAVMPALFSDCTTRLFSPLTFIRTPTKWLEWIDEFGITHAGGPCFAYGYAKKKTSDVLRDRLDLSSWQYAGLGGEPIRHAILQEFAEYFARSGFKRTSFITGYGQAECTLALSTNRVGEEVSVVDGVTSVGNVVQGHRACIVDPKTRQVCAEGVKGEIWFQGPNVTLGYWNAPKLTTEVFAATTADGSGPWLRTGDIGFFQEKRLFVFSRLKDMIIFHGKNYSPQDIECVVEEASQKIRKNCSAVFSLQNNISEEEQVVIVSEIKEKNSKNFQVIAETIQAAVLREIGILPHAVVFLLPGKISKTTSGKIQRALVKQAYQTNTLPVIYEYTISGQAEKNYLKNSKKNEIEEKIIEIIKSLSGELITDSHQSLFSLGIPSLLAHEIIFAVSETFHVDLSAAEIFQLTTVHKLANKVEELTVKKCLTPIEQLEFASTFPLSYPQQGVLLACQKSTANHAAYNLPFVLRLSGAVDCQAIKNSIYLLVQQHDALRIQLSHTSDGVLQYIKTFQFFDIEQVHCDEVAAYKEIAKLSKKTFLFEKEFLFHFKLFVIDNKDVIVFAVLHHLICDGWSANLLIQQFEEYYHYFSCHHDKKNNFLVDQIAEKNASYQAFCLSQKNQYPKNSPNDLLKSWKKKITKIDNVYFPTSSESPDYLQLENDKLEIHLPNHLFSDIVKLAKQHACSVFLLLEAVFSVVNARLLNITNFFVGIPFAGRDKLIYQNTVGLFVNILPLLHEIELGNNFQEHLHKVQAALTDLDFSIPYLTHADVVGVSSQVKFGFLYESKNAIYLPKLKNVKTEIIKTPDRIAGFDLVLVVQEKLSSCLCTLEYKKKNFDTLFIQSFLNAFINSISAIITNPQQSLQTIPMISLEEYNKIVYQLSQAIKWMDCRTLSICRSFSERVNEMPHALAIVLADLQLTYNELQENAIKIANAILRQLKNKKCESCYVILRMERSVDYVAAMLGVMLAGCVFIPFGEDMPEERLLYIKKQSGAKLIIDHQFCHHAYTSEQAALIQKVAQNPLACVMYTSGSTGVPKGVMITQQAILRLVVSDAVLPITSTIRVAQTCQHFFDVSLYEFFFPLLNGGTCFIVDQKVLLSNEMPSWLQKNKISHFCTTTAICKFYLENSIDVFSNIKILMTGGELLDQQTIVKMSEYAPHLYLINAYGPTENCIVSTCYVVSFDAIPKSVPIGKPVANTTCYVLDKFLQPCPVGVVGELYLGGDGIMQGYLHDENLTKKSLIHNPFLTMEEMNIHRNLLLYSSGDLARWLPSGDLQFIGRIDDQFKLRSQRVHPLEVEKILEQHPQVAYCIIGLVGEGNQARIVAFIKNQKRIRFDRHDLVAYAKKMLPFYMVPSDFLLVDYFPLTSNGKIDRKAMVAMYCSLNSREQETIQEYIAPCSATEEIIQQTWQAVFPAVKKMSMTANFFALGGNSLIAAILLSDIEKKTGVVVPPQILQEKQTIKEVALMIEHELAIMCQKQSSKIVNFSKVSDKSVKKEFFLRFFFVPFMQLCLLPFAKVKISGIENIPSHGPLIVASNHTNWLDALFVLCRLRHQFVSVSQRIGIIASSRWKKWFHWLYRLTSVPLYVSRGYDGKDAFPLQQAENLLQQQGIVCISPEGTLNKTGRLIRAKPGVAYLALQSGAAVLPIAIYGQAQPFSTWLRFKRLSVEIKIGKLILPDSQLSLQSLQIFSDKIMQQIALLLPVEYQGHYREVEESSKLDLDKDEIERVF